MRGGGERKSRGCEVAGQREGRGVTAKNEAGESSFGMHFLMTSKARSCEYNAPNQTPGSYESWNLPRRMGWQRLERVRTMIFHSLQPASPAKQGFPCY